jgi:cold shock CspA family protein
LTDLTGIIESFDEHRGDGVLRSDDGRAFYFHCVEIADGSRLVPQGVRVTAERRVGRLGRDEAAKVTVIN